MEVVFVLSKIARRRFTLENVVERASEKNMQNYDIRYC